MGVVCAGFIVVVGGLHPEGKGVAIAGAAGLGVDFPARQQVVLTILIGPCGELHAVHAVGIGHGAGDGVAGGIHMRDLGVGNGGTGLIRSNGHRGGVFIRRVVKRFAVLVDILRVNGVDRYGNIAGLFGQDVLIKAMIGAAVKCIIQPLIVVLAGNDLMPLAIDIDVHCQFCTGVVRVKSPALYINVILPALYNIDAQQGEVVSAAGNSKRRRTNVCKRRSQCGFGNRYIPTNLAVTVTVTVSISDSVTINAENINGVPVIFITDDIAGFQRIKSGNVFTGRPPMSIVSGIVAGNIVSDFFGVTHTLP